jgi:hypothetical protein
MLVKGNELWKHIGDELYFYEDRDEYLPKGKYYITDKKEYGIILWNDEGEFVLDEYEEDEEFTIYKTHPSIKIEKLIEFCTQSIINLISDGWTKGGGMDLQPELDKLEGYSEVRRILEGE